MNIEFSSRPAVEIGMVRIELEVHSRLTVFGHIEQVVTVLVHKLACKLACKLVSVQRILLYQMVMHISYFDAFFDCLQLHLVAQILENRPD